MFRVSVLGRGKAQDSKAVKAHFGTLRVIFSQKAFALAHGAFAAQNGLIIYSQDSGFTQILCHGQI